MLFLDHGRLGVFAAGAGASARGVVQASRERHRTNPDFTYPAENLF